ncbi:MAG: bifunctional phosphoribosylaminoimidazolecarboxamide formyltransferase/IMP cyclohydrolase, partial [Deltaproteobacteria bacterium]|nr:bifunctional phosphoribosylaminoimidazolecarboxamide formyltransferase/IMP cyclohydrolase [Deltaproteobacteria bacterium]
AVIIKHTNPCGAALSDAGLLEAYRKARACDPVSAFGGIVGFNRQVDADLAHELASTFLEAIVAPAYSEEALEILKGKKNLRVMVVADLQRSLGHGWDMKRVNGGLLLQTRDAGIVRVGDCKVVTKRAPTDAELRGLDFAWRICKHVKSNAIVLTTADQTVGIGAGQMSRVDSSRIAVMKAQMPTQGTVLASDAFFPFRDGVDAAAEAGVTAIIQPGGSIRDAESIQAADEHNIAMLFTGMRHFRH